jgi:1,4-alpha-glucan branching enzyme
MKCIWLVAAKGGGGNRPLTYRETADTLVPYLKQMGFTHVEFLPLSEHPFAGSGATRLRDFFAPTHRYGSPADSNIWSIRSTKTALALSLTRVPGHFPKDTFALADFDGTHLYNHSDPRQGEQKDGELLFSTMAAMRSANS